MKRFVVGLLVMLALVAFVALSCQLGREDDALLVASPNGTRAVLVRDGLIRPLVPNGFGSARPLPRDAYVVALGDDGRLVCAVDDRISFLNLDTGRVTPTKLDQRLDNPLVLADGTLLAFIPAHTQRVAWVGMAAADYRMVVADPDTGEVRSASDTVFLDTPSATLLGDRLLVSSGEYGDSKSFDALTTFVRRGEVWKVVSRKRLSGYGSVHHVRDGRLVGVNDPRVPYDYEVCAFDPVTLVAKPLTHLKSYVESFVAFPGGPVYVVHSPGRDGQKVLDRVLGDRVERIPWPVSPTP